MLHLVTILAIVAQVLPAHATMPYSTPEPPPAAAFPVPTAPPTPKPTPYKPAACEGIVHRAHLEQAHFDADGVGRLFAQALKDHGYVQGWIPQPVFGQAMIDMLACKIYAAPAPSPKATK